MVVTITHMITKPLTMVMANLTMLLAMQKVQDQFFLTLKIISPLMDTQEYIMNTKVHMMSIHQEALLKAHTCRPCKKMNTRFQQQHFPLAATESKARIGSRQSTLCSIAKLTGSLKTLVKVPTLKSKALKERRGSIKTVKKVLLVIKVKRSRLYCRAMRK
ncbi:hypothetical protein PPACK8108_LOCUS1504 [Phakopsora pachyrhizi]|uniref:Uncharacterized protein n=1 Tax=Phakopsora pachyrhizi TaxID=170000 RepID=A0AAV0AH76_PHAPC|nr:hypothetical protein PPACK8108_LOCUS1504 [Phakopsora pachyrhizi]